MTAWTTALARRCSGRSAGSNDPRLSGAITFGMNAIVLEGDGQMLRVGQPVAADWQFD